jgi:hypothetical protein
MQLEISRKKLDPSSLCVRERKKRDTRDSERERERERCGFVGRSAVGTL